MKFGNRIGVTLLGALVLGWVFLAHGAEPAGAGKAPAATWEYAYLLNSRTPLRSGFHSPSESHSADNAYALYQKLGGRKNQSAFTLADLTSHLGAQGWELVSVDTQGAVAATYWFKRAAP